MNKACIFSIQRASYVDGPGIRTTVFFKGCNLRCAWCHNPESWREEPQLMYYENRCVRCGVCRETCPEDAILPTFAVNVEKCRGCGKCAEVCAAGARTVCGRFMTVDEVFREIAADKAYYRASGGGTTFSGGECMLQGAFFREILKQCRNADIHTAVDTAGCVGFDAFETVMPWVDLFLYDIKAMDADVHRRLTGADNRVILENYRRLYETCPEKIWVRIPVIPGCNVEEMPAIVAFLEKYPPAKVELMPYHAMGVSKARAIGAHTLNALPPSGEEMSAIRGLFAEKGVVCE